jgi:hypothetical protein
LIRKRFAPPLPDNMDRITRTLHNAQQAHTALREVWECIKPHLIAGRKLTVEVREAKRSDAQNRVLWSRLGDISKDVEFCVNGQMVKLTPEECKDILTAGLKGQIRMAVGIDGGMVLLGARTSKMGKGEMSQLLDLCLHFGDSKGVVWSPTSLGGFGDA